jgi:hypothetical protein
VIILNDEKKALSKLHDCLSETHQSLELENPTESFDTIVEFELFQVLDHFSRGPTKEAIIIFLFFYFYQDREVIWFDPFGSDSDLSTDPRSIQN